MALITVKNIRSLTLWMNGNGFGRQQFTFIIKEILNIVVYFAAIVVFQCFNCRSITFLFKLIYSFFNLIKASALCFPRVDKTWHQISIYIVKYSIAFHKYSRISNIFNILYKEILPFWWTNIWLVCIESNRSHAVFIISSVLEDKILAWIRLS